MKRRLLNGPRRAQSKADVLLSILRRRAYVSCRRYDGISSKCAGFPVKQGGTADVCKSGFYIGRQINRRWIRTCKDDWSDLDKRDWKFD